MPNSAPSDIKYQPPVKGYSYSSPESIQEKVVKKKKNIFFALGFELLMLTFLFFIFLVILNYFNILSLSKIYPLQLGFLPHISSPVKQNMINNNLTNTGSAPNAGQPIFLPESKVWRADGIFYKYEDNHLEISMGKNILQLEYSTKNIVVYKSTNGMLTLQSIFDLEKKENLGKKITVIYVPDQNGKNIAQTITIE